MQEGAGTLLPLLVVLDTEDFSAGNAPADPPTTRSSTMKANAESRKSTLRLVALRLAAMTGGRRKGERRVEVKSLL